MICNRHDQVWSDVRRRIEQVVGVCFNEVKQSRPQAVVKTGDSSNDMGRTFCFWATFRGQDTQAEPIVLQVDFWCREGKLFGEADLIQERGPALAAMETQPFGLRPSRSEVFEHIGRVEAFILNQAGTISDLLPLR